MRLLWLAGENCNSTDAVSGVVAAMPAAITFDFTVITVTTVIGSIIHQITVTTVTTVIGSIIHQITVTTVTTVIGSNLIIR